MIVIYAEKASLAKAIAVVLKSGNSIAHPKEPTIGHYEFTINGEKAVLCHGVGDLCGLADRTAYGEQIVHKNWCNSGHVNKHKKTEEINRFLLSFCHFIF